MLIHALLVATSLAAPAQTAPPVQDTFEITLLNQQAPVSPANVIRIEADHLEFVQCCLVVLRSGSTAVAVFQVHQVQLVVNRSAGGARAFEMIPHTGGNIEVRADRMMPHQNNVILFYTGDRIVGLASQNGAKMVIDKSAQIDGAEGNDRSADPVRHRNRR